LQREVFKGLGGTCGKQFRRIATEPPTMRGHAIPFKGSHGGAQSGFAFYDWARSGGALFAGAPGKA
jgi:hypothetical protein